MKLLELFAGSRSVGRIAERMGMEVCSVDVKPFDGIHMVRDVEFLRADELPFAPDVIWASPPCTTYSLAAISHHRNTDRSPKTDFAAKSDRLVTNTLAIIRAFPDAVWYMENPNAVLQYMPFMHGLHRVTVWYCAYGDTRAKPTNIFSNNIRDGFNPHGWLPRPPCYNGNQNCQHEAAPRGSRTGTQGLKNDYERSKVPSELCMEVLGAGLNTIGNRISESNAIRA